MYSCVDCGARTPDTLYRDPWTCHTPSRFYKRLDITAGKGLQRLPAGVSWALVIVKLYSEDELTFGRWRESKGSMEFKAAIASGTFK